MFLGILLLLLWSLIWKSWALWVAGTNREKKWFIFFCLFNTAGLIEILYIYYKKKKKTSPDGPHTHTHENYFLNKKTKASIKRGLIRTPGRRLGTA